MTVFIYVITDGRRLQLGYDFNVITGPDIERGPRLENTMVYS